MSGQEREIIHSLIEELALFRGEMKSFKEQTMERCCAIEEKANLHQTNPETCTIGRAQAEHERSHGMSRTSIHTILTLILEGAMLAAVILIAIYK